jgi:hypothetical protein
MSESQNDLRMQLILVQGLLAEAIERGLQGAALILTEQVAARKNALRPKNQPLVRE